MAQKARNTQCAYRTARSRVDITVVVVYEPVDARICFHIDASVRQCSNPGKYDRRTISLHSRAVEEFFIIVEKYGNRNLFIRIVAGQIDTDERYELNFRVLFQ